MRRDVLYQYDLPMEVLDDVGENEEVLDVLYARTKEKYLIPVLITRLRLLWGYPERETVYRVYDMQYVDLVSVQVKVAGPISSVLTITTVNNQKFQFRSLKSSLVEIRAGLLTIAELMRHWSGMNWQVSQRKSILAEEYILQGTGEVYAPSAEEEDDDLFEEEPLPGKGCFESTEKMFSHFPDKDEELASAREERVARLIHTAEEEGKEPEVETEMPVSSAESDAVIFERDSGKLDEQWNNNGGGDAMILPGRVPFGVPGRRPAVKKEVFSIEDDDSEVYSAPSPAAVSADVPAEPERKEEIVIIGEPMLNLKPKSGSLPVPAPKAVSVPAAAEGPKPLVTLEPKEGLDDSTIDKSLDALNYLREKGLLSDEEYKDRSLRLFKEKGE